MNVATLMLLYGIRKQDSVSCAANMESMEIEKERRRKGERNGCKENKKYETG